MTDLILVLDPAWLGIVLSDLALRHRADAAIAGKRHCPGRCCPGIEDEYQVGHAVLPRVYL